MSQAYPAASEAPGLRREPVNKTLIGQPGGLQQLQTPLLAIDLPAMDRNIAKMAQLAQTAGVTLRPHAKTHKCAAIAHRQLAAGAVGICTATIGEAEVMAAAGVSDILITSAVIGPGKPERLLALATKTHGVKVVVDNPDNLKVLAALSAQARHTLGVMVGLDIGAHREGARTIEAAMDLIHSVDSASHLELVGLFAYAGSVQHIESFGARQLAMEAVNERLGAWKKALGATRAANIVLSGAGTGSALIDAQAGLYTELQVGSYLFMDGEYGAIETSGSGSDVFEQSLWVLTRVTGVNHQGFVTTDAGIKRFSMGSVAPSVHKGLATGSVYGFQGDEHGMIQLAEGAPQPALESLIWVRPPHCDPTVNLYDEVHVLEGEQLTDIWSIEGRGVV